MSARLEAANRILALYAEVRLECRKGRLWLVPDDPKLQAKAAVLNCPGNSLACRYGALGMGGTCAAATAQLVRWVRDLPRHPLRAWEWWCCETVGLGGGNREAILAAVRESDYADPEKTRCVLCKRQIVSLDWWSLDGVTGPCCLFGRCPEGGEVSE